MEKTLAIIKPHVVRNTIVFQRLHQFVTQHFNVLACREVYITKELSEQFYAEHKEKFFYNRLVKLMGSGPSYALILEAENSIVKWRNLMGPTKVFKAIYSHPESLRALYGLSDTRNACHGSDSRESAMREIAIIFPGFQKTVDSKRSVP